MLWHVAQTQQCLQASFLAGRHPQRHMHTPGAPYIGRLTWGALLREPHFTRMPCLPYPPPSPHYSTRVRIECLPRLSHQQLNQTHTSCVTQHVNVYARACMHTQHVRAHAHAPGRGRCWPSFGPSGWGSDRHCRAARRALPARGPAHTCAGVDRDRWQLSVKAHKRCMHALACECTRSCVLA